MTANEPLAEQVDTLITAEESPQLMHLLKGNKVRLSDRKQTRKEEKARQEEVSKNIKCCLRGIRRIPCPLQDVDCLMPYRICSLLCPLQKVPCKQCQAPYKLVLYKESQHLIEHSCSLYFLQD